MREEGWIVVPYWDEFQHRDMARSDVPPWIKNYTKLLHDDAYLGLTGHQRAVLHGLWLTYASARRQLTLSTRSLTRQLQLRVMTRDLEALNDAGFIQISASKPAGAHAGLEKNREEIPYIPLPTKPAKTSAQQQLMAAAKRYVHDWRGGTSEAFDEGLDELEHLYRARLEAGDRYRLWDQALEHVH